MSETTQRTIESFISAHKLSADVQPASENPNVPDMARHWLVTISNVDRSMAVPFSQGSGHTRPPKLVDVLGCLADDANAVENAYSFEEWAEDLGFFPMNSSDDYKRAQRSYLATRKQTDELRSLLGDEAFEDLLWNTERRGSAARCASHDRAEEDPAGTAEGSAVWLRFA